MITAYRLAAPIENCTNGLQRSCSKNGAQEDVANRGKGWNDNWLGGAVEVKGVVLVVLGVDVFNQCII